MAQSQLDRDKLRAAMRGLDKEQMFYMLDEAFDLLPEAKVLKLAKGYFKLSELRPDGEASGELLATVKAFEKASRAGKYYEAFNVNSKNFMEKSRGTRAWIDECDRLLGRCKDQEKKVDAAEVRQSFDILFGLLDHIDEGHDDIIFFADEAGSWQVGVDWEKLLPSWFRVLAETAGPEEYAERITTLIQNHCSYLGKKLFPKARKTATPEQRKALAQVEDSVVR